MLLLGGRGESTVTRSFSSELTLVSESFELSAREGDKLVEKPSALHEREQTDVLEVRDVYPATPGPRSAFTRTYATVASAWRMRGGGAPQERTGSAGLEGKRVRFEPQEDGSTRRSCDDPDVRPGQLRRLRVELGLEGWLPAEARAPGASWDIPLGELARLLAPAEDGPRGPRPPPPGASSGLNVAPSALTETPAALLAAAEGTLRATARARAEGDELPHQATLEFRLTSRFDGSSGLQAGQDKATTEASDEVVLRYEGAGTLAWDPASGAITLRCEGALRLDERFRVSVSANAQTAEVSGVLAMGGTLELEAAQRRVD